MRAVFFVATGEPHTGFGTVSFPTKAIPAVKAAWEAALEAGGGSEAQPGSPRLRETPTTQPASPTRMGTQSRYACKTTRKDLRL